MRLRHCLRQTMAPGDLIVRQGEGGDCAFIIESGSVDILLGDPAQPTIVNRLGAGAMFGELAVIDPRPRAATVRCRDRGSLLIVPRSALDSYIQDADPVIRMLLRTVIRRVREWMRDPSQPPDHPGFVTPADDDDALAISHMQQLVALQDAIEGDQLRVFYQPIVALKDGRLKGFEALVRWQHPTRGLVTPDAFIPLAETAHLIADITQFVLRRACHDLRMMQQLWTDRHGGGRLTLSVNISGREACVDGFADGVQHVVKEAGVDPRCLLLEMTESTLMIDPEAASRMMRQVVANGSGIAVDDFGTGYSSLSCLAQWPLAVLKIDRSFVQPMLTDRLAGEVVRSIISLSKALGIVTVAEGIETPAQAEALAAQGVPFGQGWLFARAMPLHGALDLVRRGTLAGGGAKTPPLTKVAEPRMPMVP